MKHASIGTPRLASRPLLRHHRGGTLSILLAVLVVAAILVMAAIMWAGRPAKLAPRATPDTGVIDAETAAVFGSTAAPATGGSERAAAADAFFDALSSAIGRADRAAFTACFDVTRLYQEIARQDVLPALDWRQERDFITGLQLGLGRSISEYGGLEWKSQEIRKVVDLERPSEFLVFVRARHVNGYSVKMRWWLREDAGQVRAFDWEDLDGSWRSSTAMGVMAASSLGSSAPWVSQVQRLIEVAPLIMEGETELAVERLEDLAAARFPARFEAMRLMCLASAHCAAERFEASLDANDRAAALNADMPILHYLRAVAYNGVARHEDALSSAETYIRLLGPDAEVLLELGDACFGIGRIDAAADAYREGLRDSPDAVDHLYGLARCLSDGEQSELVEWFEGTSAPADCFEDLAILMLDAGENEAVELLAARLLRSNPADANAAYYLAEVRFNQRRFQEAATIWHDAMPHAAPQERTLYASRRSDALIAAGDWLTVYREGVDASATFRRVGGILAEFGNTDAIHALLDAHRAVAPEDIWLGYFAGVVLVLEGKSAAAVDAFDAGYRHADDGETRSEFHEGLVAALYDSGRMMHAYLTLPDKHVVSRHLAALLFDDADAKGLELLLEAHRETDPRDPALQLWRTEIHWLRGDYESVLSTLAAHRERILAHDPEAVYLIEERTIRSALRLGRLDEALEAARASTARDGDPYFEAIVHAAAGREPDTLTAILRCVALGYAPETFYEDSDAGRLLSAEGFSEVRRRFPPTAGHRTSDASENADE